ncbi:MAG TPA: A/G-specific adenine glycosylase, partial [Legionella sp.]|nr:A/G-specific adenine glycosylase [Legionella sp.]
IMLQQTQVKTVIPYFLRFIEQFPDVQSLALASEDHVLSHWSGLGYYSRARHLHRAAQMIHDQHQGQFPQDLDTLLTLPGVGPSTAAAIASLAFNQQTAILDGNVRRVLSRYFRVDGQAQRASVQRLYWHWAQACMPSTRCADYTQAIMDLGATCCTPKKPDCIACPLHANCQAHQHDVVGDYPNKPLKKSLPIQRQQFLLLHNLHDLIYLERRPPSGLWGGLWCLPSIDMDVDPSIYIRETYRFQTMQAQELITIKHSFSHYHLHILAWSLQLRASDTASGECSGRWFHANEIQNIGVSTPVRKIIDRFLTRQHRD